MLKNEYLETCIKEEKGSHYLIRGYHRTIEDNKANIIVIDDLGFIYNHIEELELFKSELIKAEIKEFVFVNSSSGLMDTIHALSSVNIKIVEAIEIEYIDTIGYKRTEKGIKFIVNE
ncbi:hypothetical protein [Clostridium sp.]|uniref:hypothetical protein n=1 Tax=Clostridium sp. TaxID=1506 RepID=UPI0026101C1A|nr:hypothetical protein [Clostridium sp.]